MEGSGIVYTLTVADARRVSDWLRLQDIDAPAYYAGVGDDDKRRLEVELRASRVKALVATVALGMGFDKPDMSFVVHFQRPGSVVNYYQQIGRAGRAIDRAEVVLLAGAEDESISDHFIGSAFPPEPLIQEILAVLEGGDGFRMMELTPVVNATESSIRHALKTLEVEGIVTYDDARWIRTLNPWVPDSDRVEAVTAIRHSEQARMADFVGTEECLMRHITRELDDPGEEDCGRCANCAGPFVSLALDTGLVQEAVRFLKHSHRPIEPRKAWPHGLEARRGKIPVEHRLEEGLALAVYGDAGWGTLVKEGKYGGAGFSDALVEATLEMLAEDLDAEPFPTWVTAVPSLRDPTLVAAFAETVAGRLCLPYRRALVKQQETEPQKSLQNGLQQARNALRAFAVDPSQVESGPVLLIDDMVDSKWSLTVCGVLLREQGSGPVYPLVLAQTSTASDP